MIKEFGSRPIRVFVVWEPVLVTDWRAPSTATLKRVSDQSAIQFWDKGRLLSRAMGEHDKNSIVWDEIVVYAGDAVWKRVPPEPYYRGGPVLDVIKPARAAIGQLLAKSGSQRLSNLGMIGAERQRRMVPGKRRADITGRPPMQEARPSTPRSSVSKSTLEHTARLNLELATGG